MEVSPTVALGFGEELVCDWPFNVGVTDAVLFDDQLAVYFDVESDTWLEDALDLGFTNKLATMVMTVRGLPDGWGNDEPTDDGFAGDEDGAVVFCELAGNAADDDGDGDDDNDVAFGDDTEDEFESFAVGDDVLCCDW